MKARAFLAGVSLIAAFAFSAAPALAGLHICNKTDLKAYVAVATSECYIVDCSDRTQGWWSVDPQDCVTPIGADLDTSGDTDYYFYANDTGSGTWSGNDNFCVDPSNAFDFDTDASHASGCTQRAFRRLDTGKAADFTFDLTS